MLSHDSVLVEAIRFDADDPPIPDGSDHDHEDFVLAGRWSTTATDGGGLQQGQATTLTWTIVPDTTAIRVAQAGESSSGSSLISMLDTIVPGGTGTDLTGRTWYTEIFAKSFERLSELSGITFQFVTYDDRTTIPDGTGVLGTRADIRIGGHQIDGAGGVLAYNYFPNVGDMVLDTADTAFYGDNTSLYRGFRNVLMHEVMHGLGIRHVRSDDGNFLMEPVVTRAFDGPQLDDILGLQRHYGDAREKNGGNDTAARATDLGSVAIGATVSMGTVGGLTEITATNKDLISIDDESDIDFYKFAMPSAGRVSISVIPRGRTYLSGDTAANQVSFNSVQQGDLRFELVDQNGTTVLATASAASLGGTETLTNFELPGAGTYFVKVQSQTVDKLQLYGITLSTTGTTAAGLTADILDVVPDPRNAAVGGVIVNFTQAVTGVDLADFTLLRNGQNIDLAASGASLTSSTAAQYVLNITSATAVDGAYVLTLNATGSGIRTATGTPLSASVSDSFTIDRVAPTADIIDIAPDPRRLSVGTVTVDFSKNVTGVDISDFSLTRDGATISLAGVAVTTVNARQYTLNLSSLTGNAGTYVLQLNAATSGIRDAAGNLLAANVTDSWVLDSVSPTADIIDIAPDPRFESVGIVEVLFTEPVTGVTANDFQLSRNGTAVSLTGVPFTPQSSTRYHVDLSAFTQVTGNYTFTLVASNSGITDLAGNTLNINAADSFFIDLTVPIGSFSAITPDPRNTTVGVVTINFTEEVTGFDIGDLQLKRDATNVPLSSIPLVRVSGSRYTIDLTSVTVVDGLYELRLVAAGSNIQDNTGLRMTTDVVDTFTVDRTAPTAVWNPINPALRTTALNSATVRFSEAVTGVNVGDFTLTRNGQPVALSSASLTNNGSEYVLNLGGAAATSGVYELKLNALNAGIADLATNAFTSPVATSFTVDTIKPTALITAVTPDPRPNSAGKLNITFSEPVTGVSIEDFGLTRDGANVTLSKALLTGADSQPNYVLDLTSLTELSGSYVLTLRAAGSGIQDIVGNLFDTNAVESFVVDTVLPQVDIVDVTPDPRRVSTGNVTINFSEPVTGVTIDDFSLTRDSVAVPLTSGLLTATNTKSYNLNLSSVATASGFYVLSVKTSGTGIKDAAGNDLIEGAVDSWLIDVTAPTADIVDVSPDPRPDAVTEIFINFNEPVTGVTASDFALSRNGSAVALTGTSVMALSPTEYRLTLTTQASLIGDYTLTLVAQNSGILDIAGNGFVTNATDSWRIDTESPGATIQAVSPNPSPQAIQSLDVAFTQDVTNVDITDFRLTRNGNDVPLTGAGRLTGVIPGKLFMLNLADLTNVNGDYVLTLRTIGSGITNLSGKALLADAVRTFSIDLNDSPVVTSSATITVAENSKLATTITATDPDFPIQTLTYSLESGADVGLFDINAANGDVTFKTLPNFEDPLDADRNNVFDVTIAVVDDYSAKVTQKLSITVTDELESFVIPEAKWSGSGGIRLFRSGGLLKAVDSNNVDVVKPHIYGKVIDVFVQGSSAADTLTLDRSGGSPVPLGGIEFEGGAGSDTLIAESAANVTNFWVLNGANRDEAGAILPATPNKGMVTAIQTAGGIEAEPVRDDLEFDLAFSSVVFTGVENLTGGAGPDNFNLIEGRQDGAIVDAVGEGMIRKLGTQSFELAGTSSYTNRTDVSEGTLVVSGTLASNITVLDGATLRGTGATSGGVIINTGGTLAPGVNGVGRFTANTYNLAPNPGYQVVIDQSNASASEPKYSQLVATSGVTILNGTQLTVTATSTGPGTITIIDNKADSTIPITGTFLNKAEGSSFSVGSFTATITYKGGDGNDVVLSLVSTVDLGDLVLDSATENGIVLEGPSHVLSGLTLGPSASGDFASAVSSIESDDDNGLISISELRPGRNHEMVVNVQGGDGLLDAWLDINQDRRFDESERITDSQGQPVVAGNNSVHFDVPYSIFDGTGYLRLRLSTAGGLNATEPASDGEVEDYAVQFEAAISPVRVDDNYAGMADGTAIDGGVIGTDRFATITQGITAVTDGGLVEVNSGTYAENVIINKNLTLQGMGATASAVIVDPAAGDAIVVQTPASIVNLWKLTAQGGLNGITTTSGSSISLQDVQAINNGQLGFNLTSASNVSASSLTATGNGTNGLSVSGVSNLQVLNGAFDGINVTNTGDVNLSGTTISSTKAVSITTNNRIDVQTQLNAGAATISLAANQDGTGSESLMLSPTSSITTTNESATAISLTANTTSGGTGSIALTSITSGGATGVVTVKTFGGAITDGNGSVTNITAGAAALSGSGIGLGTDALETNIAKLEAASSGLSGITLSNARNLIIGGVDAATTGLTASGPISIVVTAGSLTVSENVSTASSILFKTTDANAAANAEKLMVDANVSVTSSGSSLMLDAGDDLVISLGSALSAPAGISLRADAPSADDTVGATVTVLGTLTSAGGTSIVTGLQSDVIKVFYPATGSNTGTVTLTDLGGTNDVVRVCGTTGNDEISLVTSGANVTTTTHRVTRGATGSEPIVIPVGIESLVLLGDTGNDTFKVQPSTFLNVTVDGQGPAGLEAGVPPGDTLDLNTFGNTFVLNGSVVTINSANPVYKNVTLTSIETFLQSNSNPNPNPPPNPPPTGSLRFDFNTNMVSNGVVVQSPTQTGFTGIGVAARYSTLLGYGWTSAPTGFRNTTTPSTGSLGNLLNDGHFFTTSTNPVFKTNLANGTYQVTVLVGHRAQAVDGLQVVNADSQLVLASGLGATAGRSSHATFNATVTDGTLDLEFRDTLGSRLISLNGIDIRPAATGTLTFTPPSGAVADGATVDTLAITGGPASSIITIKPNAGTLVGTDADAFFDGFQVVTNTTGQATVQLRRPASGSSSVVQMASPIGDALGSVTIPYARLNTRLFDFNSSLSGTFNPQSATDPNGYVGVITNDSFTEARGYGWLTPVSRFSLSPVSTGAFADLINDGHQGAGQGTFRVLLDNGNYEVHAFMGHGRNLQQMSVAANGSPVVSSFEMVGGGVVERSFPVTVTNGILDLTFASTGDPIATPRFAINGLQIRPTSTAGQSPSAINVTNVGSIPANGTSTATLNGTSSLATGSLVTVTTSLGTITTTDADPILAGTQIVAGAGGSLTATVRSSTTAGTPTIEFRSLDGTHRFTNSNAALLTFTADAGGGGGGTGGGGGSGGGGGGGTPTPTPIPTTRQFDFNRGVDDATMSATPAGYIGVRSNHQTPAVDGFGWTGPVTAFTSSTNPPGVSPVDLYKDGHSGSTGSASTFLIRAAVGKFYNLSAIIGRYGRDLDQVEVTGEGKPAVIAPATSWDRFTTVTITGVTDSNSDGFIALTLNDVGGQTTGWAIVGLDVVEVASAGAITQSITVREVTARQLSAPSLPSVPVAAPPEIVTPRALKSDAPLSLTTGGAASQAASTNDIDSVFARLEGLALWQ